VSPAALAIQRFLHVFTENVIKSAEVTLHGFDQYVLCKTCISNIFLPWLMWAMSVSVLGLSRISSFFFLIETNGLRIHWTDFHIFSIFMVATRLPLWNSRSQAIYHDPCRLWHALRPWSILSYANFQFLLHYERYRRTDERHARSINACISYVALKLLHVKRRCCQRPSMRFNDVTTFRQDAEMPPSSSGCCIV